MTGLIKMEYSKKYKAFTLIELMVTIMIMGIMAAIAMPSMNAFVAKTRINNRADQIANLFRYAKGEAVRMNLPVILCGDTVRKDGRAAGVCNPNVFTSTNKEAASAALRIFADKNRDGKYVSSAGDVSLRTVVINGGNQQVNIALSYCSIGNTVTCKAVTDDTKQMVFFPDGRFGVKTGDNLSTVDLMSNYVQFILWDAKEADDVARAKVVVVSPSGNVKVCSSRKSKTEINQELCE